MYVDRPVAVASPCLSKTDKIPPRRTDLPALRFYFCKTLPDGSPDKTVVCESDADFRELIFRVDVLYDFVEKVRGQCVE